jgi:hypothetical protein
MSIYKTSKISVLGLLGILTIMIFVINPAYADPIVKPTSAGTLSVSFSTDPVNPKPGDQTKIKLDFLNKQNTLQNHIDYKISVIQGGNQVFGIPVTHTAEGFGSIPFQFQTAGTYQIIVEVDGILFQPIPPETANFTLVVGDSGPKIPEFGPLAGMIIAVSIIGVITISKSTRFRF